MRRFVVWQTRVGTENNTIGNDGLSSLLRAIRELFSWLLFWKVNEMTTQGTSLAQLCMNGQKGTQTEQSSSVAIAGSISGGRKVMCRWLSRSDQRPLFSASGWSQVVQLLRWTQSTILRKSSVCVCRCECSPFCCGNWKLIFFIDSLFLQRIACPSHGCDLLVDELTVS